MKEIKNILIILKLFLFLASCGAISDAGKTLRNEKTRTTDEFLVKKREPLSMPPDYEKLPKPKSQATNNNSEKIDNILKIQKKKVIKKGSSSVEQSIINQIRK